MCLGQALDVIFDLKKLKTNLHSRLMKTIEQELLDALDRPFLNDIDKVEAVCEEWDVQWAIFRPLRETTERDLELIKDLRHELREDPVSNIGVAL